MADGAHPEPAFLSELAADAVLTTTYLEAPLHGAELVALVVRTAGSIYLSKHLRYAGRIEGRDIIAYEAALPGGEALQSQVTLSRDEAGKVVGVNVGYSPLAATRAMSALLKSRLGQRLGQELFL
uniref:Uncharacterized protein n=1 Tax=Caulobacter sp. (strain K31) TaxID=366602 RepID=B0T945_CAUSK